MNRSELRRRLWMQRKNRVSKTKGAFGSKKGVDTLYRYAQLKNIEASKRRQKRQSRGEQNGAQAAIG
jgi:hypothetical protein